MTPFILQVGLLSYLPELMSLASNTLIYKNVQLNVVNKVQLVLKWTFVIE